MLGYTAIIQSLSPEASVDDRNLISNVPSRVWLFLNRLTNTRGFPSHFFALHQNFAQVPI